MSQRAGQWIDGGQQRRGGGSLYKCTRAIVHNASCPPSPSSLLPPPPHLSFCFSWPCLIVLHRKNKRRPPGNSGTTIKAHPQAPHGHPSISVDSSGNRTDHVAISRAACGPALYFRQVQVLHIRYSLSSTFKYHTPISCFFHPQYCSTNNHVRPQDHRLLRPRYVMHCPSHDRSLIIPVQTSDFPP